MKQHIALTGKAISLCAALIFAATIHAATLNVKNFGAKGDGKTLDSPAINATIEACVSKGGGTVTVPAGNYLCGSIHLKSNIELHLDAGATITATDQKGAYDPSEEFGFPEY